MATAFGRALFVYLKLQDFKSSKSARVWSAPAELKAMAVCDNKTPLDWIRLAVMGIEDFIEDALHKPSDYIAYHVGRELAELHPEKVIIEGKTGYFDLDAFVRAEKCSIVKESSVFNHFRTSWPGPDKEPKEYLQNSWLNVLWRGHLLDVVLITWTEGCYRSRHHWIVAENKKLAEAFFVEVCDWSSEVRGEILVFRDGEWEKNEELYNSIKIATFENLILPDSLKRQVQTDFEQFFRSRDVYEGFGIPWKRGALFIGPPGNGKTHTVKALINQLGRPCLYVKGFKSEYGTEQENMGAVFARARITTPCLLVLEDLDSMIDEENRSFFLNELDGFETNTGLVVLATTNYPNRLDPAILNRPSRFDRKYYFNLPAAAERLAYIVAWNNAGALADQDGFARAGRSSDTVCDDGKNHHDSYRHAKLRLSEKTIQDLVEQTENFSFAYLKELFLSATMHWMSTREDLLNSTIDQIVLDQAALLRAQMTSSSATAADPSASGGRVNRATAGIRRFLST